MKLAKKLSTLLIALLIVVAACGFTKATKVSASEEKKQITVTADAEAAEVVDEAADASAVSGKAFGAALVVGLAAAAGAIAMGMSVAKSSEAIARQPEATGDIRGSLMLGLILIETVVIYALIVAILIIFVM
ncbi:MAG: ATP synthase F0 subunit C [Eubacterium sp.]|nr:ATP synthase F0 subunit C [Eubacterium sp.]